MKHRWLAGITIAFTFTLALAGASVAHAATINTFDRGWYRLDGVHNPVNDNYGAGKSNTSIVRNWFAFNLPTAPAGQQVVSASLLTYTASVSGGSQTITLYDVGTSITTLTAAHAAGAAGQAIYGDLGSGTSYGSRVFAGTETNQTVSYTINASGLAAINAALGGQFAIAGQNSGESSAFNTYVYLLSNTGNPSDGRTQLLLEFDSVIPLPSAAGLGAVGLLHLGCRRRRITG